MYDPLDAYFSFEPDLWEVVENAELRLHRFERFLDHPVLCPGPEGAHDDHRVDFPNVIRTGDRFTMWYKGMRPPPANVWHMEERLNICIAYSDDGLVWERPDLPGSTKRRNQTWPANVLRDVSGNCYSAGVRQFDDHYVMKLTHPSGLDGDVDQTTFSIYRSDNGINWRCLSKNCLDHQHFEPTNDIFKWKKNWYVLGQGLSPFYSLPGHESIGRVMFAYESKDLKRWHLIRKPAFHYPIPKHFPRSSLQVHMGANTWHRGRLLLGFMGQFWPAGFSELVGSTFGLVYSYDGKSWSEPFLGEPLLLPDNGSWDCGMLLQGNGCYSRGPFTYYWYAALNGGNLWQPKGSVGICRIRRDGFCSWGGRKKTKARLQTRPLQNISRDDYLYLNLDATPKSPVAINIVSADSGNVLHRKIINKGNVLQPAFDHPVSKDSQGPIKIRMGLQGNSKLYSFYIGPRVEVEEHLNEWMGGAAP